MPLPLAWSCYDTLPLAAVRPSDLGVLIVLVLFAWWGAYRGALRQVLSLGVLIAALVGASRLGPGFENTVGKLSGLDGSARAAAAWCAALFLGLVAGALLLRFLSTRLPAAPSSALSRWIGGSLGLAKGAIVLLVTGYALLAAAPATAPATDRGRPASPSLSRPDSNTAGPVAPKALIDRVRGSLSASWLVGCAHLIGEWVDVPAWIKDQVRRVNRQLESSPERRPRGS